MRRFLALAAILIATHVAATPAVAQTLTRGAFIENPDDTPSAITIQWWTNVAGNSTVEYGLTTALGQSQTVAQAPSCEIGSAGTCHAVTLTGLQPGTRYYYRLLTNAVEVQALTYFTTMKAPADPGQVFFAVIGDWGQGSSAWTDIANRINAADPQLIATVGDNAYQNGTQSDWDNNALAAYRTVMRRVPFFPALGNHDLNAVGASNWPNSVEIKMFREPRNAPAGFEEQFYSFDHGDAHFVVLDSNDPADPVQRSWLAADLAATPRKWKFAFLHHAPYSCASGLFSFGSYLDIRNNWGPLFEQYGVDIVFLGHDHIYEKSGYVDDYLLDGSGGSDGLGTYYVMTGGGGATLDGAASMSGGVPVRSGSQCYWLANDCTGGPGGSSYCSIARFQYSEVRITGNTQLELRAVDRNGVVFDDMQITKAAAVCGNGVLESGEACDLGPANGSGSCCTGLCAIASAGTTCRPAADVCDAAEACDGTQPSCPANTFLPATTACRASLGVCDPAETCTGGAAACPSDAKSTALCRPVSGPCDVAEQCDGVGNDCPADGFAPNTSVCRASAGPCDLAETCSGSAAGCPPDGKSVGLCRPANGPCDVAEFCTGADDVCPPDVPANAGTPCRAAVAPCDVAETCNGSSIACPADGYATAMTACRPAAGPCDVAELCTGTSPICPADVKSTAVCRPAAGVCDLAESCNGSSDSCPADLKSSAVCRPSAGACDVAEACSGGNDCPGDAFQPSTLTCRPANGTCDRAETCTGSSATCPADAFEPSSTTCRAAAGVCDLAEHCTGSSGACPTDQKSTTQCRAAAGPCDVAEQCNGIANTCPADAKSSAVCRPAAGSCDLAESCSGSSDTCPPDVMRTSGAVCRDAVGICDVAETCSGSDASCPADVLKPTTAVCRPSTAPCDAEERCTGDAATCPPDVGQADGDADGTCDVQDVCPGVSDPAQADGDGDGTGDACDPCTNVGPRYLIGARLTLQKLLAPAGDDRMKLQGTLTIPLAPSINPIVKGLRVLVSDASGGGVLDAILPGGAYTSATAAGWTANGSGTSWTYRSKGAPTPLVSGITKASVKRLALAGQYKVQVTASKGTFPVDTSKLPLTATVIIDAPIAASGQCADAIFPGPRPAPSCAADTSGATVRCR